MKIFRREVEWREISECVRAAPFSRIAPTTPWPPSAGCARRRVDASQPPAAAVESELATEETSSLSVVVVVVVVIMVVE